MKRKKVSGPTRKQPVAALQASESPLRAAILRAERAERAAGWLASVLEDKEEFCCECFGFRPDYSYPESAGDTCAASPGDCGYSWEAHAYSVADKQLKCNRCGHLTLSVEPGWCYHFEVCPETTPCAQWEEE